MRKYLYTLLLSLLISATYAQSNFYKLGIGAGAGVNKAFADLEKKPFGVSEYVSIDYFITPFITTSLEIQLGKLTGGDKVEDPHLRYFQNSYTAFMFNAKVRAGQFTDFYYNDFLNYTKGFYIGAGIGGISNKVDQVKIKPDASQYAFNLAEPGLNIVLPVNVGIDFYFSDSWGDPRYILNLNLQGNLTMGEGLDGYDDPQAVFKNKAADMYGFFSLGFRYTFGPSGLSRKTIR